MANAFGQPSSDWSHVGWKCHYLDGRKVWGFPNFWIGPRIHNDPYLFNCFNIFFPRRDSIDTVLFGIKNGDHFSCIRAMINTRGMVRCRSFFQTALHVARSIHDFTDCFTTIVRCFAIGVDKNTPQSSKKSRKVNRVKCCALWQSQHNLFKCNKFFLCFQVFPIDGMHMVCSCVSDAPRSQSI